MIVCFNLCISVLFSSLVWVCVLSAFISVCVLFAAFLIGEKRYVILLGAALLELLIINGMCILSLSWFLIWANKIKMYVCETWFYQYFSPLTFPNIFRQKTVCWRSLYFIHQSVMPPAHLYSDSHRVIDLGKSSGRVIDLDKSSGRLIELDNSMWIIQWRFPASVVQTVLSSFQLSVPSLKILLDTPSFWKKTWLKNKLVTQSVALPHVPAVTSLGIAIFGRQDSWHP